MFNAQKDNIAIFLTHLRILKPFNIVSQYLNPYIIAIVTDKADGKLKMSYRYFDFPNSKVYQSIIKAESSVLVYGPNNPGEFVTLNLMLMDSDANIRLAGQDLDSLMNQAANKIDIVAALSANPAVPVITSLAEEIFKFVAAEMKKNNDDPIMFIYDSWLQGLTPPYGINQYKLHSGPAAELTLSVYPIAENPQNKWTSFSNNDA
jgi:hypothetical protein